jgi:hypothetical protein
LIDLVHRIVFDLIGWHGSVWRSAVAGNMGIVWQQECCDSRLPADWGNAERNVFAAPGMTICDLTQFAFNPDKIPALGDATGLFEKV